MRPASWASSATELRAGWARQLLLLGVALLILLAAGWVVELPRRAAAPPELVGLYVQPLGAAQAQAGTQALLNRLPAPGSAPTWQPQHLPLTGPAPGGLAADERAIWWHLLPAPEASALSAPGRRCALYVPRVSGGAVLVAGWREGRWSLQWDGTDLWREQWNRPVWVDVGTCSQAALTRWVVGVAHPADHGHRISRVYLGPTEALLPAYEARTQLQQSGAQVGSLAFLALGVIALVYWLGRPRESSFLVFALTSVAWTLRNLHYYATLPRQPEALAWFWWMTNASLAWVMALMYLFALHFDPQPSPRLTRALVAFVLGVSLLSMPLAGMPLNSLLAVHLINAVVASAVGVLLTLRTLRTGGEELRHITLAFWLTEAFGLHDLLLVTGAIAPSSIYLLPYASLVVLLAFLYAAQRRYVQATRQAAEAQQRLEEQLARREEELRQNHERLRSVEREQALLLERQRLVRDMHDGLGSNLMSALVLAEQGRLSRDAVTGLLRECLDDLRLVIDSLEPIGNDLVTLLALLRHRLARRLEAAGLNLVWAVDDLPPLDWLTPPEALQVLRIVQEVLNNVLRHAHARQVRIAISRQPEGVRVAIEDDGIGFDPALTMPGRGLRHLRERAARLGGRLRIDSRPGLGTCVQLDLAFQRKAPA
ncbi:sensor histidine kinase [Ideonella oryzae]|uniref:Sensor histidine kinase n=1 Tax=Ideonella oryzae TaxID=2937441 RepID=A0ABT1BHI0_9BURK|nr:sensor histidine kinase [Ideonella oryzae]MCO5975684.1 sensor histidine kinase [Ideonella oryzae]